MSTLANLIQELCPNGVETVALGDVIEDLRTGLNPRTNFELNTPDARNHYVTVRELNGFGLKINDKTDRVNDHGLNLILKRSRLKKGDILFSGTGTIGRTSLLLEDPKNWGIKEGVYAITPIHTKLNPRYLIYLLTSPSKLDRIKELADGSTVVSIPMASLRKLEVELPPLKIQEEIVRILDTFTELEAELEAELDARRAQFDHYVTTLFRNPKYEFQEVSIGEIARCYAGATPLTTKNEFWDGGTIPWIASGEVNKGTIYTANAFITKEGYESSSTKMVPSGSVLIALAGQGKTRGMVARTRLDACTNQSLCAIVPHKDNNPDYLFFFMRTQYQNYRAISSGEGGRGGLNLQKIKSIKVPLPKRKYQDEIVEILEKFDALFLSMSSGLPGEIATRRQQYKYYRSKLLTFKELDVE